MLRGAAGTWLIVAVALLSTLCGADTPEAAAQHGVHHPAVAIQFAAPACSNSHADGALRLCTHLRGLLPKFNYTICAILEIRSGEVIPVSEDGLVQLCWPFSPAAAGGSASSGAVPGMLVVCQTYLCNTITVSLPMSIVRETVVPYLL